MRSTRALPPSCALLLALLGCHAESVGHSAREDARPRAAERVQGALAAQPSEPSGLSWGDQVRWTGWEAALETARAENKAICLVVYANWCSHCKELAPVFGRPDVAHVARDLVMVRQDQDARPSWLSERFADYGSYVPRVLFLSPDGAVRTELVSGHPTYPHFYAPMVANRLVANMRAAAAH